MKPLHIAARTTLLPLLGAALLCVVAAGCGDDLGGYSPSSSYTPPAAGSAALQCRNLSEDVCAMWVDCGELPGSDYNACTNTLDAELDCDLARDTSYNYQSCVRDLDAGCYEMQAGLPSSCNGVILF